MGKKSQAERDLNLPPPIIVYGVANIRPVQDLLQATVGDDYSMKLLANDQVEIQLKDKNRVEQLTAGLKSNNNVFEISKKNKEETYKVVLRNMHPSVDTRAIIRELELYGHKIVSISNVKNPITQEAMPLFNVELEPNKNNEEIYEITRLSNMIVAFEPLNQRKTSLQCTQCHSFGHTENFCDNVAAGTSNPEKGVSVSPLTIPPVSASTPSTTTETPVAYVQPMRSRASKNRRSNSSSHLRNGHAAVNTIQEQMAVLNRLTNLEAIVNSTLSSLESMLRLTATLKNRLN